MSRRSSVCSTAGMRTRIFPRTWRPVSAPLALQLGRVQGCHEQPRPPPRVFARTSRRPAAGSRADNFRRSEGFLRRAFSDGSAAIAAPRGAFASGSASTKSPPATCPPNRESFRDDRVPPSDEETPPRSSSVTPRRRARRTEPSLCASSRRGVGAQPRTGAFPRRRRRGGRAGRGHLHGARERQCGDVVVHRVPIRSSRRRIRGGGYGSGPKADRIGSESVERRLPRRRRRPPPPPRRRNRSVPPRRAGRGTRGFVVVASLLLPVLVLGFAVFIFIFILLGVLALARPASSSSSSSSSFFFFFIFVFAGVSPSNWAMSSPYTHSSASSVHLKCSCAYRRVSSSTSVTALSTPRRRLCAARQDVRDDASRLVGVDDAVVVDGLATSSRTLRSMRTPSITS